jgi:hypothetical protein
MFVTAFDENYAHWGELLAKSLTRLHPDIALRIIGVDLSEATKEALIGAAPNGQIHEKSISASGPARPAAIANARPGWLAEIAGNECPEWLFLLDADLLFRRSLAPLIAAARPSQAAMILAREHAHRPTPRHLRVASGFILFNRRGFALIDQWREAMDGSQAIDGVAPGAWFWEQTCLFDVYRRNSASIFQLTDHCLGSPPFEDQASVWSANVPGPQKIETYERFVVEWRKMECEAQKSPPEGRASCLGKSNPTEWRV